MSLHATLFQPPNYCLASDWITTLNPKQLSSDKRKAGTPFSSMPKKQKQPIKEIGYWCSLLLKNTGRSETWVGMNSAGSSYHMGRGKKWILYSFLKSEAQIYLSSAIPAAAFPILTTQHSYDLKLSNYYPWRMKEPCLLHLQNQIPPFLKLPTWFSSYVAQGKALTQPYLPILFAEI